MHEKDIENRFLLELYKAWFSSDFSFNLKDLQDKEDWEENLFWNLVNQIKHNGFINSFAMGGSYTMTPAGIIYTEELGIPPQDTIKANQRARTLILVSLAEVHNKKGHMYSIGNNELLKETGLSEAALIPNLQVLNGLGYSELFGNGRHKITYEGLDAVKDYNKRKSVGEEFNDISNLLPQPRGRALQKFLAKLLEQYGWEQEEGVTTSFEEMDVIIFREREYYLFECKWEKEPIEAKVVRELFGKLGNRIDVRGIVVSMSGFTSGAIEQVEKYIGQKVVLLFGKQDIESMVYGKITFDILLNQKYKELVMRGKVSYE